VWPLTRRPLQDARVRRIKQRIIGQRCLGGVGHFTSEDGSSTSSGDDRPRVTDPGGPTAMLHTLPGRDAAHAWEPPSMIRLAP
jgi:hypothetical protein